MAGRLLKTAIAAVLAVALLTSCGGSDSDTASNRAQSTDTAIEDSAADTSNPNTNNPSPGEPDTAPDDTSEPDASKVDIKGQIRNVKTGPLRVPGGGPEQFRGIGDYTTMEFGKEATPQALADAARVVHEYLVAHVRNDWASSCSLLDEHAREEVTILGSHFEEVAGEDCPTIIAYLLGKVPARKAYVSSEVKAGVLRVRREGGYIFYWAGGEIYTINLSRDEDGSWKLASLFVTNPPS